MPRPKDENGVLLPQAHKRLKMAPFHEAALFAMDEDPRSPALPIARKLVMIDKAVDHVIDGEKRPNWIAPTADRPNDPFLFDLWNIAVREVQKIKRSGAHV